MDVLAVMDEAAEHLTGNVMGTGNLRGFDRVNGLREARAAVAELIEAAEQMAEATGGDRCRCRANLRAALARVQGGAA